jgi:hypothetical protein
MQLAAVLLVSIGGAGLIVMFAVMRRRMEQLRRWKERDE